MEKLFRAKSHYLKYFLIVYLFVFCLNQVKSQQTIYCTTFTTTFGTGSVDWYQKIDGEIKAGTSSLNAFRGWAKFNITQIPDNSVIAKVGLYFYVNTGSTNPSSHELVISRLLNDPVVASRGNLWDEIDNYDYYEGSSLGDNTGNKSIPSIPASSNLQSSLSQNWFAIGFFERWEDADRCIISEGGSMLLEVQFNLPAPSNVSASDGDYCDKVRISWNSVANADGYMVYKDNIKIGQTTSLFYDDSNASTTSKMYDVYAYTSDVSGKSNLAGSNYGYKGITPSGVVVSGGGTQCGGARTLTASGGSGGTIYYQGTNSSGTSTATQATSRSITSSGTYYFRARSSAGCWGDAGSATVTINDVPANTIVSGGGTYNGSATLSASGGSGGTIYFQGTTSNGTSTATPATSRTVTESGTYYFRSRSSAGCWGEQGSATVTINPVASIGSVTGKSPICIGENATYTASSVVLSGGTGAWSSSNTAVATVNSSGVVTGVSAGTSNIKYEITGGYGGTISKQQTVTVNPNASIASVTGVAELCIGGTGTYTANSVVTSGGSGVWSSSNTSVATVSSSGTVTTTVTAVAQGTANIIYTITSGCGGTVSASRIVTIKPDNTVVLASATGSDNQTVCISTPVNNILYTTTIATGATFTGLPPGVTGRWEGNLITISGSATASGVFNYNITLTGGCGTKTATGRITVTSNNTIILRTGVGSTNQSICENTPIEPIVYYTTRATGASFAGLPPGVTGAWRADSAYILGTPTQSGTFNYTVTLTGGCGTITATGQIASNPNAAVSSVTGPGQICLGSTENFTANGVEPGGGTGAWSSSNPTVATVSTSGAVSGVSVGTCNIIYTITDGCGGEVSAQRSVTVVPKPVGGAESLTICSDVALSYDIQTSNINILGNGEPSSFSWIATANQNVSGESITAKTTSVIDDRLRNVSGVDQTVIYTIIPTGTNGCAGAPITITVTVKSEPVGMDEALITCSDNGLNYNLQTANINLRGNRQGSTFGWAAAVNSSISGSSVVVQTSGVINDNIINTSGAEQSVLYTVTPTGTNGCVGKPFTISVKINPSPIIVMKWGDVLICSNAHNLFETYRWLRNGIPIEGATQQYYTTSKQSGAYRVEATDINGCKSLSNEISLSGSKSLNLYPNPASNSFTIDLDDAPLGKAVITILDGSGVKIKEILSEKRDRRWHYEIPVNDLNEGTYLVIVSVENVNIYTSKIVVIKGNSAEYYEK